MSCPDCNAITSGDISYPVAGAVYVRVGGGNVEIVGCRKHQRQLIRQVRQAGAPADLFLGVTAFLSAVVAVYLVINAIIPAGLPLW